MTGDPLYNFRMDASSQNDQGMIKGWNFHAHLPNFWEGRSFGDLSSSPMVNDSINHAYINEAAAKTLNGKGRRASRLVHTCAGRWFV